MGVWAQDLSGGLDFLTPAVLLGIQTRRWWLTGMLTLVLVLLQEGMGTLAFGASLLFYVGTFALFFASHWLLEPENPLFMLFFSLCLSCWLYGVLTGTAAFQELPIHAPSIFSFVGKQWGAYMVTWGIALVLYQRWVRHGHL